MSACLDSCQQKLKIVITNDCNFLDQVSKSNLLTKKSRPRRFFAAEAEVGEAFVQMAQKGNLTLYNLLNDILKKAVELDQSGSSLQEAFRGFRTLKTSQEIGFIAVPEKLWYETAEIAHKVDPRSTSERFAEAGDWIGKYSLAKSKGRNRVEHLIECLSPLTHYSGDFSFEGGDTVRVRCVSHEFSTSYADSFATLLSRAFEKIGYQCTSRNVSKGMLLLSFQRSAQLDHELRGEILA